MSIFESMAVDAKPSPEQGALRLKRSLAQTFQQLESNLMQIRGIVERHGADKIKPALGGDQPEVVRLYGALKSLVEQHKPGTSIPDLQQLLQETKR